MSHAVAISSSVLVLNRHWLAVHVCTVRRALSLLFQDLAQVVTEDYRTYNFESWRDLSEIDPAEREQMIHTPSFALRVPNVIVLHNYQNCPPRNVRFNRRNIYVRDQYCCQYCGRRPARDDLSIDHVVPRSRGGHSTWNNVVLACTRCNAKKGDRLPNECGMHPLTPPKRPSWMTALRVTPTNRDRTAWERFIDSAYWNTTLRE